MPSSGKAMSGSKILRYVLKIRSDVKMILSEMDNSWMGHEY
jgi:hypothetical protein